MFPVPVSSSKPPPPLLGHPLQTPFLIMPSLPPGLDPNSILQKGHSVLASVLVAQESP